MPKYKVLKRFKDLEKGQVYEKHNEVELTAKRADEISEKLKDNGPFLEKIETKKAAKKGD